MNRKWIVLVVVLVILALLATVDSQAKLLAREPQTSVATLGTGFIYQGQLKLDDQPVDNTCDFIFTLYGDELGSVQIGIPQTMDDEEVSGGLFTAQLDFGASAFQGDVRWLGVQVQCQGDAEYTDLGLQELTATPYALYALGVSWSGIIDMPASFADGVDDVSAVVSGTAIYAGEGLNQVSSGNAVTMSITPSYRLPQTCANGRIAEWDGSTWVCGDDDTDSDDGYWSLTGNVGTDPGTHFLGTSDGVTLTLAVSGMPVLRLEPTGGTPNLIGGSKYSIAKMGVIGVVIGGGGSSEYPNRAMGNYVTIGGGENNAAGDAWATIGGGAGNTTSHNFATIGGGGNNIASSWSATVSGGFWNTASGWRATVGGGGSNAASGADATVVGGSLNTASGSSTTVGGGEVNTASSDYATVGGGTGNTASGNSTTVGGGYSNTASGIGAFVGGGGYDGSTLDGNEAFGDASVIGGGLGNVITTTAHYATIGGGRSNIVSSSDATVGGGENNIASSYKATIGGGSNNIASGYNATVGGGWGNTASGTWAIVSGGYGNTASSYYTTVGGGNGNIASGTRTTVGGGEFNTASASCATVGGGLDNTASASRATVGGGEGNLVAATHGTIAGGYNTTVTGDYATVGGGYGNTASGERAAVGGGENNTASGDEATVPGGQANTARGNYSFAAGRRAQANNQGCFVWGDSTDADVTCDDDDRWVARASGGVYFYSNAAQDSGSYLAAGGSNWNSLSDRARKENLRPVDSLALLESLAAIEITTWNYLSQAPSIRHIGPMAQDFNTLLPDLGGEGQDYINSLDADGVALAAIQGLYAQNQALQAENADLHQRVDDLEARLSALESGGSTVSPIQSGLLLGAGLPLVGGLGLWLIRRKGGGR